MPVVVLIFLAINSVLSQEELQNPICNHWLDPGECNDFSVKWYYDRYDHRCRRFHYSGCGGNPNRFDSLEECTSSCLYTPPTTADRCSLPHAPGHCNSDIERWFFDWNKKQCVCSYWTGCGGNSNIYYSYNHCMQICGDYAEHGPGIDENYWGVLNKSTMTIDNQAVFAPHQIHPASPLFRGQYQEMTVSESHAKTHGAKTVTSNVFMPIATVTQVESNQVPLPPRSWKKYRKQKVPPRKITQVQLPTATQASNEASPTFSYNYFTDDRGNQIPIPRHVFRKQFATPTQVYATYKTDRLGRGIFHQKIWWTGGGPMPIHALRTRYPHWLPPPYDGFGRNPYEEVNPNNYRRPTNRWPAVPPTSPPTARPAYSVTVPHATPAYWQPGRPQQQQTWPVRPTNPVYTPAVPPETVYRPTRPYPTHPPVQTSAFVPRPTHSPHQSRNMGQEINTAVLPTQPPVATSTSTTEQPTTTTSTTTTTTSTRTTTPVTTTTPISTRPPPPPPPPPPTTQNSYNQHSEVYVRPAVEDMTTRVAPTARPTWRTAAEPMEFQRWLVEKVTTEKPMSIDDIIALDEESYDEYDMEMEPDSQEVRTNLRPVTTSAPIRQVPTTPWAPRVRTTPARTGWQPIVMPPPSHLDAGTDYADNVDFDIRPIPGA